jgi:hypothetical protein
MNLQNRQGKLSFSVSLAQNVPFSAGPGVLHAAACLMADAAAWASKNISPYAPRDRCDRGRDDFDKRPAASLGSEHKAS